MKQVRTRFAPSPTGYLHIGGVRTALFCWLYARKYNGQYILRIEDTDRERSTQAATDAIIDGLAWLGLDADEGPFFQSQRFDRYREVAQQLLEAGHAYHCYCTKEELEAIREQQQKNGEKPRYNRCCRELTTPKHKNVKPVLRFKTPVDGEVIIDDLVHGRIKVSNQELDDFIILRSDNTPTYNFTVVVDDADMEITHVIRGDDHINNTPKQIHIFNALGVNIPKFAHLPMINGQDGRKLSKRHGAVSVLEYEQEGYLPEALLNYLARLGWSHGDQELFTIEEMIEYFDITNVNKSSASFDVDKLQWTNQHHLKKADSSRLAKLIAKRLSNQNINIDTNVNLNNVVDVYREKVKTLKELADSISYLFMDKVVYDPQSADKFLNAESVTTLESAREKLLSHEQWQVEPLGQMIKSLVKQTGLKFPLVAQPLRVALTGSTNSPSIDQTLWLVGKDKSLQRLSDAIDHINK